LAESSKEFKKKLQEKGVDVSPWLAVMAKAHGLAKIFEKWSMMVRWQHIFFYHDSHCKMTFPSFIFDVLCSHPYSKQFPSCHQDSDPRGSGESPNPPIFTPPRNPG
jgi:isopentenyldiphosphate isomerase